MSQHITVVILNYNCAPITQECVQSILANNREEVGVVIVDNSSTDGSYDFLSNYAHTSKRVRLLRSPRNGGFAEGSNIGITWALAEGAEWVHLLNPDTTLQGDFYASFLNLVNTRKDLRAIGALGLYSSDPDRIWFGGGYFDWFKARGECKYQGLRASKLEADHISGFTDFLTCACLLVHRDAVESVGLLDTRYFLGGEEWDYSRRLGRAGFKLYLDARLRYWHQVTATHTKYSPKFIYNGYRTKLLFMREQHPCIWPFWLLLFYTYLIVWASRRFRKLAPSLDSRAVWQAMWHALRDDRRYRTIELSHLEKFEE